MAKINRIRVYDGTLIDPFNPATEDLHAHNFIHASSQINRYAGNGNWPYSIGQHSWALMAHVPFHLRRAALIHDWAECWFQDMPQPIKVRLATYSKYEHAAMVKIGERFGVSEAEFSELKPYDKSIYIDERNAFMNRTADMGMGDDREPLGVDPYWLHERNWRDIRNRTHRWFNLLFPEHKTEYDFGR